MTPADWQGLAVWGTTGVTRSTAMLYTSTQIIREPRDCLLADFRAPFSRNTEQGYDHLLLRLRQLVDLRSLGHLALGAAAMGTALHALDDDAKAKKESGRSTETAAPDHHPEETQAVRQPRRRQQILPIHQPRCSRSPTSPAIRSRVLSTRTG